MTDPLRDVTEYHLHGEDMEIAFYLADDKLTWLEYNGTAFSGPNLHREPTVLGIAASITLETSPDGDTLWLTVFIPEAHAPDGNSIPVETFAVLTTKRTSPAGPAGVSGQVEVYKVVRPVNGNGLPYLE